MSWIYYAIGAYLLLCWMISGWLLFRQDEDCPGADEAKIRFRALSWKGKILIAVAMVVLAPLTPLLLVYVGFQCFRQQKEWNRFLRMHRGYLFEQKHVANMPEELQQYIDRRMPEFEKLGFKSQGDYVLKPEPFVLQGRCLMSNRGETVATVLMIDDQLAFTLTSILENGRFLETASTEFSPELAEKFNSTPRMAAQSVDPASITEAYNCHCKELGELEKIDDCKTLAFDHDQFQNVMHYVNQVFGDIKFEWGELDEKPEIAPELPTGELISINESAEGALTNLAATLGVNTAHDYRPAVTDNTSWVCEIDDRQ